jgi:uridine phosphorylase
MPTWEEIFLKEYKKIVFRLSDPQKLPKILIIAIGVPSKNLENKLHNKQKIGLFVIGKYKNIKIAITSRKIGTIQLEELLRLLPNDKVEYIIGLGAVGALQPDIQIGDLIIPTEAVRGDGLTQYYYPSTEKAVPDPTLTNLLIHSSEKTGAKIHKGTIFTSGSLLHETDEFIYNLHSKGYLGVDCEASAFFLLCKYCGFKGSLVLYVTDNPYTKQIFSNSFKAMLRLFRAERKAIKSIFQAVLDIEEMVNGKYKG